LNVGVTYFQGGVSKLFAGTTTRVGAKAAVEGGQSLIQANRAAGNAFRDEVANILQQEGREVSTEVFKRIPFGKRFIDIEVNQGGKVLGGIEAKVGASPYTLPQRAKDLWFERVEGYPVNLIRKTN